MKIAKKFDVVRFGSRSMELKLNLKGKKVRRFDKNGNKKEYNMIHQRQIDLEKYKKKGQCF